MVCGYLGHLEPFRVIWILHHHHKTQQHYTIWRSTVTVSKNTSHHAIRLFLIIYCVPSYIPHPYSIIHLTISLLLSSNSHLLYCTSKTSILHPYPNHTCSLTLHATATTHVPTLVNTQIISRIFRLAGLGDTNFSQEIAALEKTGHAWVRSLSSHLVKISVRWKCYRFPVNGISDKACR